MDNSSNRAHGEAPHERADKNAERQAIGGRSGGLGSGETTSDDAAPSGCESASIGAAVTLMAAANVEPWNAQPAAQPGNVHSSQWQHGILSGLPPWPLDVWQGACATAPITAVMALTPWRSKARDRRRRARVAVMRGLPYRDETGVAREYFACRRTRCVPTLIQECPRIPPRAIRLQRLVAHLRRRHMTCSRRGWGAQARGVGTPIALGGHNVSG
jgi:hypothetical protein